MYNCTVQRNRSLYHRPDGCHPRGEPQAGSPPRVRCPGLPRQDSSFICSRAIHSWKHTWGKQWARRGPLTWGAYHPESLVRWEEMTPSTHLITWPAPPLQGPGRTEPETRFRTEPKRGLLAPFPDPMVSPACLPEPAGGGRGADRASSSPSIRRTGLTIAVQHTTSPAEQGKGQSLRSSDPAAHLRDASSHGELTAGRGGCARIPDLSLPVKGRAEAPALVSGPRQREEEF